MFRIEFQASSFRLQAITTILIFASVQMLAQYSIPKFDVQGHRGARGLMPENSIPAFKLALDSGVTTIELDLAVTKDKQLVVSHEPWMSAAICTNPQGEKIDSKDEKTFNIFEMTYDEVKLWDCGSMGNSKFPEQQKIKTNKPLLKDVIAAVEEHIKSYSRYQVDYNIEIKSDERGDNVYHPTPEEFSDLVISTLNQYLPLERIVIQSFDFRVLKYIHKKYPGIRLAVLIENLKSIDTNLNNLGFVPNIYSPAWQLLNAGRVKYLQTKAVSSGKKGNRLRVIPWTVNEVKDMQALKKMGVDGFITDYPNRARKIK
jgi:glycerophosphoryl diester phosphodiesterase